MSDRIVGLSLAGKTFYWNVNESRSGSHYLTIIAKKGTTEEKLVLFDSQIPSFIHKTLEAYAEICQKNGVPLLGSTQAPEAETDRSGDEKGPAWAAGTILDGLPPEPHPLCPQCGAHPGKVDVLKYHRDGGGCIRVEFVPDRPDKIRVRCMNCGWVPEGGKVVEVGNTKMTLFSEGSDEYNEWGPYVKE